MTSKPGEVVLVQFPFSDLSKSKQRPALVLATTVYSRNLSLITIAMITSQTDQPSIPGDLILEDWEKSGLLHPSRLRLAKIATLEAELVKKKLGTLSTGDQKKTAKAMRGIFKHWL
jgi:mRNA interferase MazF